MDTLRFSLEQMEAGLRQAFPSLQPLGPLALLGEGFGSLVVETPGGLVFRIARVAEAGEAYAREALLLPRLQPYLPVAIPDPQWYLPRTGVFTYGVSGYRKLPGAPLEAEDAHGPQANSLADGVGRLLHSLHRAPPGLLPAPVPFEGRRAAWRQTRDEALPALQAMLKPVEYQAVNRWWGSFLADEQMSSFPQVVTHGDFWHGNLLAADGQVLGLLDFQDAAVDDPARDFAPLLYLGEPWLRRVIASYQHAGGSLDAGFEHRLWNLWALREFGGVVYSLRHHDWEELADSIEKIRKGPILSRYGLDGWGKGSM